MSNENNVTEVLEAKKGTEVSEVSEVSESTETPATTEAPVAAEVSEVKEETESTKLLEQVEVPVYKVGDIIKGIVSEISERVATIELDNKFKGILTIGEVSNYRYNNIADALQIGQEVECKILDINQDKEEIKLSKREIDMDRAWERVTALQASDEAFEVTVLEALERGLVCDIGIRAFIPAKQIAREFVEDLSVFVGQKLTVKVKDLSIDDKGKKSVILSARVVLDELAEQAKHGFMESLKVGQEFTGTVERIAPFGVFVNIGPVDGLVHVSELSWEHVNKPEDVVSPGDTVKVKLIALDLDKQKISLSLKALMQLPWESAAEKIKEGDELTGIVRRITEFGAFVEIAPGVDGLVHISELSHTRVKTVGEAVRVGEEVRVKVLQFDVSKKKAGLSVKALLEKPIDEVAVVEADRSDIEANSNKSALTQTLGDKFGDKLSGLVINQPKKK